MAFAMYLLGRTEDLGEELVNAYRIVVVDVRDDGLLVEGRERIVYGLHGFDNLWLQVGIVLVGNGVECTEYLALLSTEGGSILADDDNASYDKEQ